jgi:hypothetical protein
LVIACGSSNRQHILLYCVVISPSHTINITSRIRLGWTWRDDDYDDDDADEVGGG